MFIFADFGDFLCYIFVTVFSVFLMIFHVFWTVFVMFFCCFLTTFLTLFACLFDVVWRLCVAPCYRGGERACFFGVATKFSHKKCFVFFSECDSRFHFVFAIFRKKRKNAMQSKKMKKNTKQKKQQKLEKTKKKQWAQHKNQFHLQKYRLQSNTRVLEALLQGRRART